MALRRSAVMLGCGMTERVNTGKAGTCRGDDDVHVAETCVTRIFFQCKVRAVFGRLLDDIVRPRARRSISCGWRRVHNPFRDRAGVLRSIRRWWMGGNYLV